MKGGAAIVIGLTTIFIATFMLFFIFGNIERLAERCKDESPPQVCSQLSSFTFPMLITLLIIAGFILIICVTAYIILSLQSL